MGCNILILGASYGSLFGTKALMAGHDVTLVCREATAGLINQQGTEVRLKLKEEAQHRTIFSHALSGRLDANTPEKVDPARYDLVVLAMQEPQYLAHAIRTLLMRVATAGRPCLSLMNMPPLPYMKRIPGLETTSLERAYTDAQVWDRFDPDLMSLCSPDPQAFRPPDEAANVLHVGLGTNFKAAAFGKPEHTAILETLAADIEALRLDGKDVPVKLKVFNSLYVPFAKWSMLLTGNYRCIQRNDAPLAIREAVHGDLEASRRLYDHVGAIVERLGADRRDLVPFEKYANAATGLLKPSSAARAVASGAPMIERVDKLVQLIGQQLSMPDDAIDRIVTTVDGALAGNQHLTA
ncbi:MAG: ketopantoate reductase family protein [Geminicoccaceae bacterium]